MNDVVVKKSKINGKGVFAMRNFKKGEVVMIWKPIILERSELKNFSEREKDYIASVKGKFLLMQSPEKFVNHSCKANTSVKNFCDIAKRNIKKGEEITGNYKETGGLNNFRCVCGSKKCHNV